MNERNYTNSEKTYYEVNGIRYSFDSIATVATPKDSTGDDSGTKAGMVVGNYFASPASYFWSGDISEIIYFDDVLREPEKEALNEWLNRKYGNTPTCTLPADTTGYVVSGCDVSGHAYDDALTEGECSVSCDTGYVESRVEGASASCTTSGSKFVLSGCFPSYDGTRDPPSFVTNDNVSHWDTYYGVSLNESGNVQEWSSYPNKDGDHTRLISVNSTGATLTQNNIFFAERPTVTFDGGTHLVSNNYFNYMDNASEHTKIVVAKAATNNEAPVAGDNSAGYEAWINGSYFYSRSSHAQRSYGRANRSSISANLNLGFVTVTTYDSSQATNALKMVTRINGDQINYDYFYSSSSIVNPKSGADYNFYLGSQTGSNNFKGDIAEVIWFDRKLTNSEILEVESYLMKKWGIQKVCKKPSSITGYDLTSCDFDSDTERRLKPSECTLSCDTGYRADNFEAVTASCYSADKK